MAAVPEALAIAEAVAPLAMDVEQMVIELFDEIIAHLPLPQRTVDKAAAVKAAIAAKTAPPAPPAPPVTLTEEAK